MFQNRLHRLVRRLLQRAIKGRPVERGQRGWEREMCSDEAMSILEGVKNSFRSINQQNICFWAKEESIQRVPTVQR